jgi:hypothetical protein
MSNSFRTPQSGPSITAPRMLNTEREALERRLAEGYVKIEEALARGQDVSTWERFWIELLHEYEEVCNQLSAAA